MSLTHKLVVLCVVIRGFTIDSPCVAQQRSGVRPFPRTVLALERDYLSPVGEEGNPLKTGEVIDIWLSSGKQYSGLTINQVQTGKDESTFRGLTFERAKGLPSRLQVNTFSRIRAGDRHFEVLSDPAAKAWVLLDLQKRDEVAAGRLRQEGNTLWEALSEDDIAEAMKGYRDQFAKADELFPGRRFFLTETNYFLFYTDMPPHQVNGYIASLDAMYDQLCLMYGIPKGTNIWYGKCPVVVFQDRDMFLRYEAQVMGNSNAEQAQGLHHGYSDGRSFVVVYRGDDPAFFGAVLVHETTHGFNHRYRSNVNLPNWVDEGIADFVAGSVVRASQETSRRQQEAAQTLRASRSLGGNFFANNAQLDRWQYGAASSLVHLMVQRDPNLFRAFLVAIKEGYRWPDALDLTYGLKPEELLALYAQSIGTPGLQP